ncbi:MAG: hypothetical protein F4Z87_04435, partial [Gammaproteobacteria bacterium]|nr:hypothetical protein [Gammaproteobacteria bacterium]
MVKPDDTQQFMQSLIQFSLLTVFLTQSITTIQASSEMLPDAMKLGAKDCGYCHASSTGGEALNERGTWLKNELSERSETTIDVEWLLEREQDEMEDTKITKLSPDLVEEASNEG